MSRQYLKKHSEWEHKLANILYKVAAQQAHVADRPCWGVFNASDFDKCFPDLSIASPQGRRLTRNPLGQG